MILIACPNKGINVVLCLIVRYLQIIHLWIMEQYNANRATISFHLTQEEKEQIVDAADQNGQTITDYLKDLVFTRDDSDDTLNLLKQYDIDDLEEVLQGWTLLMEDDHVCHEFKLYEGKEVTINTIEGPWISPIESKMDIILLKIWSKNASISEETART